MIYMMYILTDDLIFSIQKKLLELEKLYYWSNEIFF